MCKCYTTAEAKRCKNRAKLQGDVGYLGSSAQQTLDEMYWIAAEDVIAALCGRNPSNLITEELLGMA